MVYSVVINSDDYQQIIEKKTKNLTGIEKEIRLQNLQNGILAVPFEKNHGLFQ